MKDKAVDLKYETWDEIEKLLNGSSSSEIVVLNEILKNVPYKKSKEIIKQIKDLGLPRIFGETSISYYDLLKNCANHLNIYGNTSTIKDLEQNISQIYLKNILDKLPIEKKLEFERTLQEFSLAKGYGKEFGTLAALTGAQLSGFGVYLAASTIVGGIDKYIRSNASFCFLYGDVFCNFHNNWSSGVDWFGRCGIV